jgi:Glyoxalase-like domain
MLGWPVSVTGENGAAIQVPGTSSYLSFDNSPDYIPPVWPATAGHQRMMMHIDIAVDDLATAVADAIEQGATLADFQPQESVRVLLDPAGHPFCLYLDK